MQFSSKYEYTLLALLELTSAYPKGEFLHIRQIAALQNIPSRYLEQILATLRNGGLIKSTRGSKGGYILTRCHTITPAIAKVITAKVLCKVISSIFKAFIL